MKTPYPPLLMTYFETCFNYSYHEQPYHLQGQAGLPYPHENVCFYLKIQSNLIEKSYCQVYGGVTTIALCGYLCEWLEGKTYEKVYQLNSHDLLNALTLMPIKQHCANLIIKAIHQALP